VYVYVQGESEGVLSSLHLSSSFLFFILYGVEKGFGRFVSSIIILFWGENFGAGEERRVQGQSY
jgi:hypothetical protein